MLNSTSHFSSRYKTLNSNNRDCNQIEQEEWNLHVPMHTQENGSLTTQENKLNDFYSGAFVAQSGAKEGLIGMFDGSDTNLLN